MSIPTRCFTVFLPSFLQHDSKAPNTLHATAWLDGLRGIAAFFVVIHHSSLLWFDWDVHAGKWDGTVSGAKWLVQIPFIRLLIAGSPQVMIFFAISGYALSYKPLRLARQGRLREVRTALLSSLLRRHARLFLPTAVITFLTAVATWLGCFHTFESSRPVAIPSREPPRFDTLWAQLRHYAGSEVYYTNPFQDLGPLFLTESTPYDPNLWTLPIEFRWSMVLLAWLLACTRMPNRVRMACSLALAWYAHWIAINWGLFLFLCGMLVCDVHFEIENISSKSKDQTTMPRASRRLGFLFWFTNRVMPPQGFLRKCIALVSFLLAIYVLSTPYDGGADSFGFMTLASSSYQFLPELYRAERHGYNFVVPIAAVWLIATVDQASFLRILFTNRFSLYMGTISFPLYLVHGPLLWTWGSFLTQRVILLVGQETEGQYLLSVAFAAALWWPVAIFVADLANRFVDVQCVALIRWLYIKLENRVL